MSPAGPISLLSAIASAATASAAIASASTVAVAVIVLFTIAAAPFGVALCLLTVATGSFWTAAAIHLSLAVGNGLGAVRFRPDIRLR